MKRGRGRGDACRLERQWPGGDARRFSVWRSRLSRGHRPARQGTRDESAKLRVSLRHDRILDAADAYDLSDRSTSKVAKCVGSGPGSHQGIAEVARPSERVRQECCTFPLTSGGTVDGFSWAESVVWGIFCRETISFLFFLWVFEGMKNEKPVSPFLGVNNFKLLCMVVRFRNLRWTSVSLPLVCTL